MAERTITLREGESPDKDIILYFTPESQAVLNERDQTIISLVLIGRTNDQIALILNYCGSTIRNYVSNIFLKIEAIDKDGGEVCRANLQYMLFKNSLARMDNPVIESTLTQKQL